MENTMNTEEMNELYSKIAALEARGDTEAAKALLMEHLPRLPENLRTEIMLEMFTSSLEAEASGLAFKRTLQEEGLRAAKTLEEQAGESH
jgi:hypothetical protein